MKPSYEPSTSNEQITDTMLRSKPTLTVDFNFCPRCFLLGRQEFLVVTAVGETMHPESRWCDACCSSYTIWVEENTMECVCAVCETEADRNSEKVLNEWMSVDITVNPVPWKKTISVPHMVRRRLVCSPKCAIALLNAVLKGGKE